eukprot:g39172.t1
MFRAALSVSRRVVPAPVRQGVTQTARRTMATEAAIAQPTQTWFEWSAINFMAYGGLGFVPYYFNQYVIYLVGTNPDKAKVLDEVDYQQIACLNRQRFSL